MAPWPAQHPAVQKLLAAEVERANAQLARVEQVKAFRVLPKALDPEEEGEPVTPTRKVKRTLMVERFREWSNRCTTTARSGSSRQVSAIP